MTDFNPILFIPFHMRLSLRIFISALKSDDLLDITDFQSSSVQCFISFAKEISSHLHICGKTGFPCGLCFADFLLRGI